jgi:hypothetical protein
MGAGTFLNEISRGRRALSVGLGKPNLAGYPSGGVTLQTAAKYPAMAGPLVIVSANIRRNATYLEMFAQQGQGSAAVAEVMTDNPMYQRSPM